MTTTTDRVTWQELAALVDALGLTPTYDGADLHVEVDGTDLCADVRGVQLAGVPGADALQRARLRHLVRTLPPIPADLPYVGDRDVTDLMEEAYREDPRRVR